MSWFCACSGWTARAGQRAKEMMQRPVGRPETWKTIAGRGRSEAAWGPTDGGRTCGRGSLLPAYRKFEFGVCHGNMRRSPPTAGFFGADPVSAASQDRAVGQHFSASRREEWGVQFLPCRSAEASVGGANVLNHKQFNDFHMAQNHLSITCQ